MSLYSFTGSYMQLDENWCAYLAYENCNRAWYLHDRDRIDPGFTVSARVGVGW